MKEFSNIHVALLGRETAHIKTAFRNYTNTDKLILIVGEGFEDNAEDLKNFFNKEFEIDVDCMVVQPFTKEGALKIVDHLKKIREDNKKSNIYLNITGGTNLMAGIALSAALMVGCEEIYYILKQKGTENDGLIKVDNNVIGIPIPKLVLTDALTDNQKNILLEINQKIKKSNPSIKNIQKFAEEYYGTEKNVLQKIHGHLKALESMNLIKIKKDKKEKEIELTESGNLIVRFLA